MKQPKIGFLLLQDEINGRCDWVAGLYFIKNCLHAISTLAKNSIPEIVVFIPDNFVDADIQSYQPWLTLVTISAEQLLNQHQHDAIEQIINSHHCDIYFPLLTTPQFVLNGAWLGWIPDFQDKYLPEFFRAEDLLVRRSVNSFISAYCTKVLCISETVNNDFKRFYPEYAAKSHTIHFRTYINESLLNINPAETLKKFNLQGKKYIYLPNQFWAHKNHRLVFAAWKKLKEAGLHCLLVCTGTTKDFRAPEYYQELLSYLAEYDLVNDVKLLGYIDRNEQIQLFRAASAILQPSLFEGWSTSLEEAKSLGKFIFASDIPVHREQCKHNVIFFAANDVDNLVNVISDNWPQLPFVHDIIHEQQSYQAYQHTIKQFGKKLVELFTLTYQNTSSNDALIHLPVYLYRQMQIRQEICKERIELINRLHLELDALQETSRERLRVINRLNADLSAFYKKESERITRRIYKTIFSKGKFFTSVLHFLIKKLGKSYGR